MFKYLVIFLVAFSYTTKACFLTKRSHVYIHNDLPSPPLRFHCKSSEDDFGLKSLDFGKEFTFTFCPVPLDTQYRCQFLWNGRDHSFNVFDEINYFNHCIAKRCYYSVREDGFYLSNHYPPNGFKKVVRW